MGNNKVAYGTGMRTYSENHIDGLSLIPRTRV